MLNVLNDGKNMKKVRIRRLLCLFLIRPEQTVGMKRNNEMCFGFDTSI